MVLDAMIRKKTCTLKEVQQLIKKNQNKVYGIVDTAKDETLFTYLKGKKDQFWSLFVQDKREELKSVSPYLFKVEIDDQNWLFEQIVDQSKGLVVIKEEDHESLITKLSNGIYQKDEAGKRSLFRHYDPVVLAQLLKLELEENAGVVTEIYDSIQIIMKDPDSIYSHWQIGMQQ